MTSSELEGVTPILQLTFLRGRRMWRNFSPKNMSWIRAPLGSGHYLTDHICLFSFFRPAWLAGVALQWTRLIVTTSIRFWWTRPIMLPCWRFMRLIDLSITRLFVQWGGHCTWYVAPSSIGAERKVRFIVYVSCPNWTARRSVPRVPRWHIPF